MNIKSKIPAFTIIEAIVSMAVTAIILSVIFVIFSVTSRRLDDFKNESSFIADINRMTYCLNKDIFESDKMYVNDKNVTFLTVTGERRYYDFSSLYFERSSAVFKDTFNISIAKVKADTLRSDNGALVYQRLFLEANINKEITNFTFYKKIYPNEELNKL